MIMEGILNNWNKFLKEGVNKEGKIELKYYAFDWDDNIMNMPTKIIFNNVKNEEVVGQIEMSTEEFAHERSKIGKPFEFRGELVDLRYLENDGSFANFRDNPQANRQFIEDAKTAELGPVFADFVKAINEASFFAIITARGHSPHTLKQACFDVIKSGRGGINIEEFLKNFNIYRKAIGLEEVLDADLAIHKFLSDGNDEEGESNGTPKNCQFSPVSHPSISGSGGGGAASPEELKKREFNNFSKRMRKKATFLRAKNKEAQLMDQGFLESHEFRIGFSDDDIKNAKAMAQMLKNSRTSTVFHTSPSGKQKLNAPT